MMRAADIPHSAFRIPDSSEQAKLKKACREFEAIFLGYVMKGLRATVPKSDFFGSAREEEIWRDMLDDEVCRAASARRGLGLADLIYKQLSRYVGESDPSTSPAAHDV